MYIELHLRNIKLSRLITSGIITLAIVLYVFNTSIQDAVYVLLLIPVFILLTLFGDQHVAFATSFISSCLISYGRNYLFLSLSSAVSLLGFLTLYRESSDNIANSFYTVILLCTPLYILNPLTLVHVSIILLVYLLLAIRENLRLGKSTVEVYQDKSTIYLDEQAKYFVLIKCPGAFRYKILESGKVVEEGSAVNEVKTELSRDFEYVGLNELHVGVFLEDLKGLAKLTYGPYTLKYIVLLRASTMVKRAEKVLEKYMSYISIPKVHKVVIGGLPQGETGGSRGVEGVGRVGLIGKGALGGGESGLKLTTSEGLHKPLPLTEPTGAEGEVGERREKTSLWFLIARYILREIEMYLSRLAAKSHTGEYIGVREYMLGDSPKIIHWKKSLRREDLENVYVRLYAREIKEGGGGRGSRVLYVDLTSTNQRELDLLVSTLYSELLRSLSRQSPLINTHLFLKLPEGDTYYINGKLVDVIATLNTIIQKHGLQSLYNYQSWRRRRLIMLGEARGIIGDLESYYKELGLAISVSLGEKVGEGSSIVLIHSNALAYKYSIISRVLQDSGFIVSQPTR